MSKSTHQWWEEAVIYQIYPLSFADANGDGIGDLKGIIKRLDYLNDGNPGSKTALGIDAIWLSPINQSPMIDNGYDISNYYDICEQFGTLEDFCLLVQEAHKRNIKIILDLVINHTSNQHQWFLESSSCQNNPKSDWYLWQDPAPGGGVPNNWLSYFGGTGWSFVEARQQYYYHSFNKHQPDLNWSNPEVRLAIYQIIRFWLNKGVDGFRLDASSIYSKDRYFRHNPLRFGASDKNNYHNQEHLYDKNLPENHQIIQEIREILDEYGDKVLIGETFIDSKLHESNRFYGIKNNELHLPLNFEFCFSPWYPEYLQREIEQKELLTPRQSWPSHFLDNHDIPRHLSRWVECSLCTNTQGIAEAAAAILLTVRGTAFLYYGQEIGMVDNQDIPAEKIQDKAVIKTKTGETPPPRDGSRTPMQWDDSVQAGFSFGKDVEPWLPVNANYLSVNVKQQLASDRSILKFYQALIRARKNSLPLRRGSWRSLIHYPYEHLVYVREYSQEQVLVIINFSYEKKLTIDEYIDTSNWKVLVSNIHQTEDIIDVPSKLEPFAVSVLEKLQ